MPQPPADFFFWSLLFLFCNFVQNDLVEITQFGNRNNAHIKQNGVNNVTTAQ
jgi:hypothetical protein